MTERRVRIAELFHSVQGEGRFVGTPSVFLRTTGCNLRCWFCDTPYTSWRPEGEHVPWRTLLARILAYECEHVVVTGGEPLLQPDVVPLTAALTAAGCYVTIETAGTVFRPVQAGLLSISPKLANSDPPASRDAVWALRHAARRNRRDVVRRLIDLADHQLKFVIDQPADLVELERYLDGPPPLPRDQIWLMAQGTTVEQLHAREPWLRTAAAERGYHVTPRRHIELFGNTRGT